MTERKNTILVYGNPARAWLLAILRALIDMEGKP
jgi:hypothetical protein